MFALEPSKRSLYSNLEIYALCIYIYIYIQVPINSVFTCLSIASIWTNCQEFVVDFVIIFSVATAATNYYKMIIKFLAFVIKFTSMLCIHTIGSVKKLNCKFSVSTMFNNFWCALAFYFRLQFDSCSP